MQGRNVSGSTATRRTTDGKSEVRRSPDQEMVVTKRLLWTCTFVTMMSALGESYGRFARCEDVEDEDDLERSFLSS